MSVKDFVEDDLSDLGDHQITVLNWMTLNEKGQQMYREFEKKYNNGLTNNTLKHCMIAKNPSGINIHGDEKNDNICAISKVRTASFVFMDREHEQPEWAYTVDYKLYKLLY